MNAWDEQATTGELAVTKRSGAFEKVNTSTLVSEVTHRIRESIVNGDFDENVQLVERSIGESLGVSTIAIREAFARLESEGLIYRMARRGAFVRPVTAESVQDISQVRIVVEQLAVERAIANWAPEWSAEALGLVRGMRTVTIEGGAEALFALDREFHRLFNRVADSPALADVWRGLDSQISRYLRLASRTVDQDEIERVAAIHERWLKAVEAGNADAARLEVAQHIETSCQSIVNILNRKDEK